MIVDVMGRALLGILVGLLFGWGHLWLLRQAIEAGQDDFGDRARQAILRGMPVRVLLWAPAAVFVIHIGLPACVGLLMGMIASRLLYWHSVMQPR